MSDSSESARRILFVLDPEYGQRLFDLPEGQPTWVLMSPANLLVIEERWRTAPSNSTHLTGITGCPPDRTFGKTPDEQFQYWLPTIDQHHDITSTYLPYTALDVVGVPLSQHIRQHLALLGF